MFDQSTAVMCVYPNVYMCNFLLIIQTNDPLMSVPGVPSYGGLFGPLFTSQAAYVSSFVAPAAPSFSVSKTGKGHWTSQGQVVQMTYYVSYSALLWLAE